MGIKCIALDLDGTTLHRNTISPANRRAIEEAVNRGVHVVVASGRSWTALPGPVMEIPGIKYAITSNGAAVYECGSRKCIRRVTLEPEAVLRVLEITRDMWIGCETFVEGEPYAQKDYIADPVSFGAAPYVVDYIQSTRKPVDNIREFIKRNRHCLDGIDIIAEGDSILGNLFNVISQSCQKVYVTSSVANRVEVAHKEAGKHKGLRFLLERFGISPDETAAFGDGDNDVEMLSFVKYGFAMENGSRRCKEAAAFRTSSNEKDGVAEGICRLLEIPF